MGKKEGKQGGGALVNIIVTLVSAGLIIVLQVGFIFLLLGLLPAIVAFFIDDSPRRNVFKSVLACNLAGMMPMLAGIAQHQSKLAAFQLTMTDPVSWIIVYGSAGGGWILVWICQFLGTMTVAVNSQNRIVQLEKAQKKLLEEWGPQVKRRDLVG